MLGGMVLGSVITLLATPKSGAEVRGQIKDLVNREARKVRDKYHEVEGKVEEAARQKVIRSHAIPTPPERSFAGALVFFLVMALSAYVLLVTALVFWLAELLGSLPLAAVLLGGFTLLIALLTYQLAVRDAFARLRERWEVVYEVMRTVHDGYRRVSGFLHRLLW